MLLNSFNLNWFKFVICICVCVWFILQNQNKAFCRNIWHQTLLATGNSFQRVNESHFVIT